MSRDRNVHLENIYIYIHAFNKSGRHLKFLIHDAIRGKFPPGQHGYSG